MVNFSHVAPPDRWALLETTLNQLMIKNDRGGDISQSSIVCVQKLADQCGTTLSAMRTKLEKNGAQPFRLGKAWVIREISLVTCYERMEREAAKTRNS